MSGANKSKPLYNTRKTKQQKQKLHTAINQLRGTQCDLKLKSLNLFRVDYINIEFKITPELYVNILIKMYCDRDDHRWAHSHIEYEVYDERYRSQLVESMDSIKYKSIREFMRRIPTAVVNQLTQDITEFKNFIVNSYANG